MHFVRSRKNDALGTLYLSDIKNRNPCLRDAIHTHFVSLIGKWTIVGGLVKHWADKRGKVAKLKYKS